MQNLRILTSRLDIEDSDMLRVDIGDALRKLAIGGFPNPAQDTQQKVFAVGLNEEGIATFTKR